MSDIVDVGGDEARRAVMEFMGQQMGSFKDLNNRVIEQSTSLRPIIPDVRNIVGSIPGASQPQPVATPPPLPVQYQQAPVAIPQQPPQQPSQNTGQLELNFTYDIAKDIVDRLERIEKLLKQISVQPDAPKKFELPLKKT